MKDDVLSSKALVHTLQFVAEVPTLDVEIQVFGVVDEHCEGAVGQRNGALAQDLVQNGAVLF